MIPIFDAGHSGLINGKYQTPGKRSPDLSKGVLYEGMFNRWVVNRLIEKMDRSNLKYYHASPEFTDVSLETRVLRANEIYKNHKSVFLLSIHANAGGGEGIELFTSPGQTKSDEVGELILSNLHSDMSSIQKFRFDYSDGDMDKEEKFYVLRKTQCAAVLLECGFMDHPKDYLRLWDELYIECLTDSLLTSLRELQT